MGFKNNITPSHPTITETMKRISNSEFELAISKITLTQIKQDFKQIAIDGKSIRSTYASLQGLLHLVSAYVPDEIVVIAQVKSDLAGEEIDSARIVSSRVNVKDKVITGDTMFVQESLCSQITRSGGHYLFKVKQNEKRIVNDINQEFHFIRLKSYLYHPLKPKSLKPMEGLTKDLLKS